jgi:CRISPR/Cas system-associated endonuclease/helicase Cas3
MDLANISWNDQDYIPYLYNSYHKNDKGIKSVLINPNIATIQTSEGIADQVYFLPVNIGLFKVFDGIMFAISIVINLS